MEIVRTEKAEETVGERETLVGLSDVVRPAGTAFESETEPVKPARPAMVMVEVPEEPTGISRTVELKEMLKSTTLTFRVTE